MAPVANSDLDDVEQSILSETANLVLNALNTGEPETSAARDRAETALKSLEDLSGKVNAAWPNESRFHAQILNISPVLVLKAGIGTHERVFVLGIPEKDDGGRTNRIWRQVDEDDSTFEHPAPRNWMEVYPLHRGPSGYARILIAIGFTGCAGSSGRTYEALEWRPSEPGGGAWQIIKQDGAQGMDEGFNGGKPSRKDPFSPIGKLKTDGPLITLPYCWFSAVDTWDNPSLCALDTYDMTGDTVRFRSETYNRPDLIPVAKVIEYAGKHDLPAVRGYCVSDDVALRIVQEEITPSYGAGDLQVIRKGPYKEHVEVGSPDGDGFDVEKRGDRWLVVSFTSGTN
jgi:hypothetical protein